MQIQISWLLQKPIDLDLHFAKAGYIQVQQDKGKMGSLGGHSVGKENGITYHHK